MPTSTRPPRTPSVPARLALALPLVLAACASDPAARLDDVLAREWDARGTEDRTEDGGWQPPDVSPAAREAADARALDLLDELSAIDPADLDEDRRISHAMLTRQLEDALAARRFGSWMLPFTSDSGFHTGLTRRPLERPLDTYEDLREYVQELRRIPPHVDQQIANLRVGLERGVTLPRVVLDGTRAQVAVHAVEDPTESAFYAPFLGPLRAVPEDEREGLRQSARAVVANDVLPAYRRLLAFLDDEYLPGARTTLGCSALPDGEAWYAHLVRHYTTLDLTPREVHDLGLEEVARIRADMESLAEDTGFEGTFREFLDALRTDPRFYATTPEELLEKASRLAKRADAELPRLFGHLPRTPYGVEPVPAAIAPTYTSGRYVGANAESHEPGYYWVNTHDLASRPLYALPALTLHEAVPGHHLQISLVSELEDLPPFRRHAYVTAFGEGWGLYSEWLGIEMGLYDTPFDEFGRMTYEMWRACRLVVDTGLHAFDWDRQRAIDYLASNTALSIHECTTEVDRYISWPGQALAYKMGELELRALRREAEAALGEAFDVRAFHDHLLGAGTLPLELLRERMEAWVGDQRAAQASSGSGEAD